MKPLSLIDELLVEQRQLTAVDRFAQRHQVAGGGKFYQDLIPLERPRPGEQYAFRVDLDACTGCKACVSACHSLNGLEENETWRTVGLLHGGSQAEPYQQTVTTACHHCVEPACLQGCPVLAYETDPLTGIVRHLDDQCIGCQYCMLKCPYDVPRYSARRGIVRKCDLCHSRLAEGEAPACVQACPSSAISIQFVSKTQVARDCLAPGKRLVPGAFLSNYTQPTTTYVSRNPLPENCAPADASALRLQPPHWPLVWMLLLTQTATGLFLAAFSTALFQPHAFEATKLTFSITGFSALLTGLACSVPHLGRPSGAWRALLGLRRSWMSREILAFLLFTLGAIFAAGANRFHAPLSPSATGIAAMLGLLAVFCSGMVYVDTRRPAWTGPITFTRFFGTTLLLGTSGAAVIFAGTTLFNESPNWVGKVHSAGAFIVLLQLGLLFWEIARLVRALLRPLSANYRSARCAWQLCRWTLLLRVILTLVSVGCVFTAASSSGIFWLCTAVTAFLATFGAQLLERYLFFVTVDAPKMPGTFTP